MLWNYLKIGYRSILKHKKSSIINSVGLGIAFSTCLVLFSFLDRVLNSDKIHPNADRKFLIEHVIEDNGRERIFGDTPYALGVMAAEEIPEIVSMVRMKYTSADIRYKDKVFDEQIIFVDDGYLNMFYFDLIAGSKSVLKEKNKIVINKDIAKKYFGDEEALGKEMSVLYSANGKEYKETYIVGAVADEFEYMTTMRFHIIIPFDNRKNFGYEDDGNWIDKTNATFIELSQPGQVQNVVQQLNGYVAIQNEMNPDQRISRFILDPLPRMALDASGKENMIIYNAPLFARIFLSIITFFILILAVLNYVNISVVSATSRLKEIGLRKTIGGTRKQLIIQFLAENTILCFIALIFAYLLTVGFTLPGFNTIVASSSKLTLDFNNPRLWIYIISLFSLVSVGSAAYPAFFISGFRPIHIFRGDLKISNKNVFAKSLMGLQFIISFITISLAVVFVLNDKYSQKRDWGYDKEQTIVIPLVSSDQYSELKDAFAENPDIKGISGSQNHMGYWTAEDAIIYNNERILCKRINAGFDYLDVMGLRLKEGRFFNNNSMTDLNESIVINEALARELEVDNPVGLRVQLDEKICYIVGVTRDFHYLDFGHEIKPIFFSLTEEANFNFIALRTQIGRAFDTEKLTEQTWKKLYPDNTYDGFFQSSAFDFYYRESKSISNLMVGIAGLAIVISSMGLFGLVSLYISKRMKEFSVRKVMGASVKELSYQVSKGFIWVMVIATVLAVPMAFIMTNSLLKSIYTYHIKMNAVPFLFTAFILLITTLITVSTQIFRAIGVNPAQQLRDE